MYRTTTQTTAKNAILLRTYEVEAYGYKLIIPAGAIVNNTTACGPDDNYRFWTSYGAVIKEQHGITLPNGQQAAPIMLLHDLAYRGINVPAEYCTPYTTKPA